MDSPMAARPNRLLDEERYYRRGSSGTIETRGMNRSRSVVIKLQVPQRGQASSPRTTRRNIGERYGERERGGEGERKIIKSVGGQKTQK